MALVVPTATSIRRATAGDVEDLIRIGRSGWRGTFVPLVGDALVEEGLCRAWTATAIAAEVAEGRIRVAGPATGPTTGPTAASTPDGATGSTVARGPAGPLGMSSARDERGRVFLARLYVDPSAQRAGVGYALLQDVLRRAGTRPVELTVLCTNLRARAFYERAGFLPVGLEPDVFGWPDQLRMIHDPHHATS